ncbi:MAG: DUF58 domain-containing protein [Planctomycetota bacterium]|nr:DUF58 domain-containing protein [Planctomycetota bacterium]MDA1252574.1 DUF58 domain-containing protein [Planctomycetota bacterium]
MRWLLAGILLLLFGIALQLGLLVYAMYALLGVILLSRYLARQWIENLSATRECNRDVSEIGDKVAVAVRVKNEGGVPVPWVLLEDSLPKDALAERPPRIKVEGRRMALMQIGGRNEKTLLYQLTFKRRGYYQIGPVLIESGDLFGLHRRFKVVTEPHFVMVYPKVIPLIGYDLSSRRPIGEIKMTHRLFEDPTRVAGVRPYQRGDALNRIHWKATARTGELHSRIFDPSTVAGATILLDFHQDSYPMQGEPHRSELGITTAASFANALCQLGQQVGFVSNGRDAADRIREEGINREFRTRDTAQQEFQTETENTRLRPVIVETQRGPEQFQQIREALARLEKTDGLPFSQMIAEATSRMPRDATVVAILGDVTTETAIALGNLRRNGYAVTALVIFQDGSTVSGESSGARFLDADGMVDKLGRLIAEGLDVRHVDNEAGIAQLCSDQLIR